MQKDDIKKYYSNCNPDKSFGPSDVRYLDIDNYEIDGKKPYVRGRSWANDIASKIEISDDEYVCEYFTGYSGSGKTTVLNNICSKLDFEEFYPIYIDGTDFLDLNDSIEIVEIYTVMILNISKGVAALLGKDSDGYLNEREYFKRFWDFLTKTDVLIKRIEIDNDWGKLVADIKENRSFRTQIRQVLVDNFSTFKNDVFQELDRLNKIVKQKRSGGIVVIFDSLEKNKGLSSNFDDVLDASEKLFRNRDNLKLPIHTIYTLPTPLSTKIPNINFLPVIRVINKKGEKNSDAYKILKTMIEKRVPKVALEEIFGKDYEEYIDKIIEYSGGYIRDILRVLRGVILVRDYPISSDILDLELISIENEFQEFISISYIKFLKKIQDSKEFISSDDDEQIIADRLFDLHAILRYRNHQLWYDLHPAVKKLIDKHG
jgi:hypothetical protein